MRKREDRENGEDGDDREKDGGEHKQSEIE
jgi:hypothetical protein